MHLFYDGKVVPIRDVDRYPLLEHAFSKDKAIAYYKNVEIAGNDAASFAVLDEHYAKTQQEVFYNGKRMPDADAPDLRGQFKVGERLSVPP